VSLALAAKKTSRLWARNEVNHLKKGLSIGVFVLGLCLTCISTATMILGAIGIGHKD
jgi:hypothetical protein